MSEKGASLLFLGTGASMGVPVIGCKCAVCQSPFPQNKRLRPSVLLSLYGKKILIDAGPDFRTQALRYQLDHLDGVIFSHAHHDHTAGIDDLRAYYMLHRTTLPCLLSKETAQEMHARYDYIFAEHAFPGKLLPKIQQIYLPKARGSMEFLGYELHYFSYVQSGMPVNGFRFGSLGFVSDIKEYPESIFEDLEGVEQLVVSALRADSSKLHFSVPEAIAFAQRVKAKETWLTHISHDLEHFSATERLPSNVFMAYDGLSINFSP